MIAAALLLALAALQPAQGWEVAEMRGDGLSAAGAATIQRELEAARAEVPALLRAVDAARRARVQAWAAASPDPVHIAAAQAALLVAAKRISERDDEAVNTIFAALSPADRRIYGAWLAKYNAVAATVPD